MGNRTDEELLQINLGGKESLDIIKLDDGSALFVISERGNIQRRTVVKVTLSDMARMAKFLVGIPADGGSDVES